jgi:hypothetical protein
LAVFFFMAQSFLKLLTSPFPEEKPLAYGEAVA